MTNRLVDSDSAFKFLIVAASLLFLATGAMIFLRRWSRRRAIAYLWFWSLALNVGLTSILLAITLPLFGMNGLFSISSYVLGGYFFTMLGYQLWKAHSTFAVSWENHHLPALSVCYDENRSVIYTRPLMRLLKLGAVMFFPPKLEFLNKVIWVPFLVALVAGLNLRHFFPVLSAILSGVPALTVIALLLQWTFFPLLIAKKIRVLEIRSGELIAPMSDNDIRYAEARERDSTSRHA